MARSTCIYIVERHRTTATRSPRRSRSRHELVRWLKASIGEGYGQFWEYLVKRFKDGWTGGSDVTVMAVRELFELTSS